MSATGNAKKQKLFEKLILIKWNLKQKRKLVHSLQLQFVHFNCNFSATEKYVVFIYNVIS